MLEITDYTILSNRYSNSLAKEVVHLTSKGWQPFGPAFVVTDGLLTYQSFNQTMVKYKPTSITI